MGHNRTFAFIKDVWGTRWDGSHLIEQTTLARRLCRAHICYLKHYHKNLRREQTMRRVKQASKQKCTTRAAAVTVLGATGLGFSLLGNASASTVPAADIAQSDNTPPNQRIVISEEEMADVSLATFHLFDRENVRGGVQLARACGGCRGCAARGCRGCAARGCAVRGCAVRACAVGCAAGSCCGSWGYCRVC
jgi:hypothetical protein